MSNFLKGAITIFMEIVMGVVWALILTAIVGTIFLLAYGILAWFVSGH